FRHLLGKSCKVVVTVLWPGGPGLVDSVLSEVAREFPDEKYGVDWVIVGDKSGREAVRVVMGQGIANAFPRDYRGLDSRSLPVMREVRDYASFPLLVNISSGYPGTKEWVQQVQARFHLPMVAGVTAVSAPEYYPYLQSGQIRGQLAHRDLWTGQLFLPARPGLFSAELGDYRGWLVIPGILGLLLFSRLFGKIGWLSRWSLAMIIGVYAGIKTTGFAQGDFVAQVQASLQPLWKAGDPAFTINSIIFTVGLIASLLFFFFSREHK